MPSLLCKKVYLDLHSNVKTKGKIKFIAITYFQPSLMFQVRLLAVLYTRLKRLSSGKHSSLAVLSVSKEEKKFYEIVTWAQCYKTFLLP